MYLKHYAIIAAVSQQQQPQLQEYNATVMSTATTTTTMASTISPTSLSSSEEDMLHSQELASSSSKPTYYNGGMGLYNQQRGIGGGISLLNGAPGSSSSNGAAGSSGSQTYSHVVNGSVNLLLGGSMLCLVTTILCVVCYCCHRNIKKRTEAAYRQQQHQWLENDPNMEIYSVEQCYETSGLFLGDSTDGLGTLPALHHEPPPSYDAVVFHEQQILQQQQQQIEDQQLQLQQQQLLLQRVSPPPGYRSSLDISNVQQVMTLSSGEGSTDAIPVSSSCSGSAGVSVGERAEVENMWNAAAAAVATRNVHCQELDTYMPSPSQPLPLALQARKHAQAAMRLNSFGRRYLQYSQHQQQHTHYRRGCPLCGKFRYTAEDEAFTASVESVLEQCDGNANDIVANAEQQEQQLEQATIAISNKIDSQIDADTVNGNVADSTSKATSATDADIDENDNAAAISIAVAVSATETVTAAESATNSSTNADLDITNINENGIISLDMSKIIDISGLPTYEGALKLESSGYV